MRNPSKEKYSDERVAAWKPREDVTRRTESALLVSFSEVKWEHDQELTPGFSNMEMVMTLVECYFSVDSGENKKK